MKTEEMKEKVKKILAYQFEDEMFGFTCFWPPIWFLLILFALGIIGGIGIWLLE